MSRKKRTPIVTDPTPEQLARAAQQATFLGMLRQRGNVREACEAAGCGRSTAYEWKDTDPAFAAAWVTAIEDAIDGLETAAWARARKQSDTLLIFLLKAHRPALYRETTRHELSGAVVGVQVNAADLTTAAAFVAEWEATRFADRD